LAIAAGISGSTIVQKKITKTARPAHSAAATSS